MKITVLAAAALLAACTAPVAQAPAAPPSTEAKPTPATTATTTQAPPPPNFCASSFCGCWTPRTLHFRVRLQDAHGAPASGVSAVCHNETTPIAQSNADGSLAVDADTQFSSGCGYQRCDNITLTDPQHRFADAHVSSRAIIPNNAITLQPAEIP